MSKSIHATIRIKSENHYLSISVDFKKESTLLEKFEQIHEIIIEKGYLVGSKLESIYFFESEEII